MTRVRREANLATREIRATVPCWMLSTIFCPRLTSPAAAMARKRMNSSTKIEEGSSRKVARTSRKKRMVESVTYLRVRVKGEG